MGHVGRAGVMLQILESCEGHCQDSAFYSKEDGCELSCGPLACLARSCTYSHAYDG